MIRGVYYMLRFVRITCFGSYAIRGIYYVILGMGRRPGTRIRMRTTSDGCANSAAAPLRSARIAPHSATAAQPARRPRDVGMVRL